MHIYHESTQICDKTIFTMNKHKYVIEEHIFAKVEHKFGEPINLVQSFEEINNIVHTYNVSY
jgi:hypothetical protein